MKRLNLFTLALAVLAMALGQLVNAQSTIRVADDSSSGTYKKMLSEVIGACADDSLNIIEAKVAGGAPGNLNAVFNNEADAAFLHSDVYLANSQSDPAYANIKTLVALYPEQIHVIVKRDPGILVGTIGFRKPVYFNSLVDLRGYRVGAAGGGVFTTRILNSQGQGGFIVQAFDSGGQVITALKSGDIQAAVFVGAAPLPNLAELDKNQFKLVPIGEAIANNVAGVYRASMINYPGLTNGPVKTLAPVATLMTRRFSTPAKIAAQTKLRNCFNAHLAELQDSGSRNWQDVQANDHGTLNNWLDLPESKPAAATPKTRRK